MLTEDKREIKLLKKSSIGRLSYLTEVGWQTAFTITSADEPLIELSMTAICNLSFLATDLALAGLTSIRSLFPSANQRQIDCRQRG